MRSEKETSLGKSLEDLQVEVWVERSLDSYNLMPHFASEKTGLETIPTTLGGGLPGTKTQVF